MQVNGNLRLSRETFYLFYLTCSIVSWSSAFHSDNSPWKMINQLTLQGMYALRASTTRYTEPSLLTGGTRHLIFAINVRSFLVSFWIV